MVVKLLSHLNLIKKRKKQKTKNTFFFPHASLEICHFVLTDEEFHFCFLLLNTLIPDMMKGFLSFQILKV